MPKIDRKPKKKEVTAKDWLGKIHRAQEVKKKWRDSFNVSLAYNYWEGNQRPASVPSEQWVTINLIYSNLLAMLPALYATDPYFYIKLKRSFRPDPMSIALYEQKGKMRQAMLNYFKEELKLKEKVRLSIFDACFQYGIFKVIHRAELIENPDKGKNILDDSGNILINDSGESLIEPEELPLNEEYAFLRIHPDDFLVDEDAGPLDEDIKWRAQRIKRPLEEAKEDTRFKADIRRKLEATEVRDQTEKDREERKKGQVSANKNEEKADVIVEWEIYDRKKDQWLVVAEGNDEYLIPPQETPPGVEKDPFVDLRFTLRDDSWYPIPPVSQWLEPQRDYCDARSKMSTHRKRFNRKYVVYESGFDDAQKEIDKLESGDDGTILRAITPNVDAIVGPIRDAPLDQTIYQEIALLRDELTTMSIGPNQRQSGRGIESATEAGIIERRLQMQEGDWISLVIDFVREIAKKLDQLIQVHITNDEAVKVTGPEGDYWEKVQPSHYEEIEGEYEYGVNVGATTPRLPEIERSQWLAFLNLLASAPQLATSKRLLKHTAELHHIDDEALIDEIHQIALQMTSGQMSMPGRQGSVPGQPQLPGAGATGIGG